MSRQILSSWKEISGHIQRGVRTAQRWEAELGMPVHRPASKERSAVVAFSDELDGWICRRLAGPEPLRQEDCNMSRLVWHTAELASQTRALQKQLRRSFETHKNRTALRIRPRTLMPASRTMGVVLPFRSKRRASRSNVTSGRSR
jgi:hypothetical protein